MDQRTLYLISTAALAVLLFFPASKLVWVFSVRRLQNRLARELTEEEIQGQLNRARFIAIVLVTLFAMLFNLRFYQL